MHFETTVEIDAPPDKVWATLVDVDRWPEWTASISTVERRGAGVLARGSKVRIKQPRMPRLVWEVTDFEPGTAFTWRSASPGVTTVASHRLSGTAETGVTVTLTVDMSGVMAPIAGLLTSRTTL